MHTVASTGSSVHIPVLLDQVVSLLSPEAGESYLDLTAGYGGHSAVIIGRTKAPSTSVLVDRDAEAVLHNQNLYKETGLEVMHTDFLTAVRSLADQGRTFDMVLADLGVSSPQLDRADRGFSYRELDSPLDMRMDQSNGQSAEQLLRSKSQSELAEIIFRFGEEPKSRKIAESIKAGLNGYDGPLTIRSLVAYICAVYGCTLAPGSSWDQNKYQLPPFVRDSITRTFQAIRIAVNDELSLLRGALPLLPGILKPGGRLAIISFHSLEDRIVKEFFAEESHKGYQSSLKLLTKNAISGSIDDPENPRARSARLRAVVKIKKIVN
jgi:16S rRNA (cytosine1402-N4)-methyltransferase